MYLTTYKSKIVYLGVDSTKNRKVLIYDSKLVSPYFVFVILKRYFQIIRHEFINTRSYYKPFN